MKLISKIQKTPLSMISNIVSDNGSKFKNQDLLLFFQGEGITHLTTSPYTSQQNPVAERGNKTTMNKARCLLKDSGLALSYWAEAVNTSVYLENLTPNSSISFEKPFQKWNCWEPSLKYLHPFGCLSRYYNKYINGKFSDSGVKGIFLGYREGHHSLRILDVEKGNVILSNHVKFNDNVFPYKDLTSYKKDSLDLLFHDSPNPKSDSSLLLLLKPLVNDKDNLLTPSPI
ncbi:hypothetical protein O181_002924 [Austropuccinia psidii MF-1]|uniref:Integrase catalytic domain-containing protein n=1 Tax=Austropuccinia psidii MF-1 TaxID=1389203 RepID=A0A9Q3GDC0_9BASI|nr:hypothetical protein [Austropuccinia psidii MF-1]